MAKKTKRPHLPGMAPPVINEIEEAAEEYRSVRNRRQTLTEQEVERQAILLKLMEKHKLKSYEYDGFVVEVVANPKVKVKKTGEEDEEESLVEKGRKHLESGMDPKAKAVVKDVADGAKPK